MKANSLRLLLGGLGAGVIISATLAIGFFLPPPPGVGPAKEASVSGEQFSLNYGFQSTALSETDIEALADAPKLEAVCNPDKVSIVLFSTQTCGYCKKFKAQVLPDAKVQERLRSVSFTDVDANDNYELARQAGVEGVPTTYAINRACVITGTYQGVGTPADFVTWLNQVDPR